MGLSRCGKFLKYSMFLFNAVILIAGCGLLGFGVYARTSENRMTQLSSILGNYYYSTLSLALIISGGVIIVVSFLGCCGAIKEVRCMLGTFFILVMMMLLSMVIGALVVYVYRDNIGDAILNELSVSLNTTYGVDGQKEVTDAWNRMQKFFECCGVVGGINSTTSWAYYREYSVWFRNQTGGQPYIIQRCTQNTFSENQGHVLNFDARSVEQEGQYRTSFLATQYRVPRTSQVKVVEFNLYVYQVVTQSSSARASIKEYVPDSCCKNVYGLNRTKCVGGQGYTNIIPAVLPPVGYSQENDILFTNGCYNAVIDFLTDNVRIFAGLAAGISVLMVMGMTFAICLCRRIKDEFLFD